LVNAEAVEALLITASVCKCEAFVIHKKSKGGKV